MEQKCREKHRPPDCTDNGVSSGRSARRPPRPPLASAWSYPFSDHCLNNTVTAAIRMSQQSTQQQPVHRYADAALGRCGVNPEGYGIDAVRQLLARGGGV